VRTLGHTAVYFAERVYLPEPGRCGFGPKISAQRRVSYWLSQNSTLGSQEWVCLVVKRSNGARSLTNHDALLLALTAIELPCLWAVLEPVDINTPGSMQHAASLFRKARLIIAPHGGSLANLLFSPQGATLLELLPQFRPNLCYERLCRALGIQYVGLVSPDSSMHRSWSIHIPSVLKAVFAITKKWAVVDRP